MDSAIITGFITQRDFALAGNARFTLRSITTGTRLTYRVRRAKGDDENRPWFVSVLTGPDNDEDYRYLGTIFADLCYRQTRKSKISPDATSARVFAGVWERLRTGHELPEHVEFWHEGRCGRCGRSLTVPESIATGLGPVCAGAMQEAA